MQTFLHDRRVLLPTLLTAVAIAVGSLLIVLLAGDAAGSAPAVAAAPQAAGGAVTRIDIATYKFKPAAITVKAGAKVSWVNHDASPHTATASGAFDTGTLKQGDSRTLTLAKPGTYAYVCEFHPFMKATVVVR